MKIHGGQCSGRVCQVISGYQPKVSAPGLTNTDLTFCTKPHDHPWNPFSKSPTPPFFFKIYSLMEGERIWKRGLREGGRRKGKGDTVQQVLTVVLSSYFTRKRSHSAPNSSSWSVSSYVWNTFLHISIYCRLLCGCKCLQRQERDKNSLIMISDKESWSWKILFRQIL